MLMQFKRMLYFLAFGIVVSACYLANAAVSDDSDQKKEDKE